MRTEDKDEPAAFQEGNYVLMVNKRVRKGESRKLSPKFVDPYEVLRVMENRSYQTSREGQTSLQNERRLKLFCAAEDPRGQAPLVLEPKCAGQMAGRPAPTKPIIRRDSIPLCVLPSAGVDRPVNSRMGQLEKGTGSFINRDQVGIPMNTRVGKPNVAMGVPVTDLHTSKDI